MLTFDCDLISLYVVKTIRIIFSYGLVLMFLIPATGFYYTRHSCLSSGEVQLVLDGEYSCCAEISQIGHDPVSSDGSCCNQDLVEPEGTCCNMESSSQVNSGLDCSVEGSASECCSNEGKYLKSEDEYISPGKIEIPHVTIIITAALHSVDLFPIVRKTIEENAHSPPYILSSLDILHKHSVLII